MNNLFFIEQKMTIATIKVGSFQLTTPATGLVRLKPIKIQTDVGPISFSLLEDYSFAAAGSVITPVHKHRQLARTSAMVVKSIADTTAVAGAGALTLNAFTVAAAMTQKQAMGEHEIVLKQNTNYLIVVTNSNAGSATVNFSISWEE